ncbi:MAG: hypothetical protein IIW77_03880 [Bacteroidaceae bacterium]|nr:hypothetical protein [Bacteroidaceae bacterium]
MKNIITIERSELQQQIDLKNFYMGDSAKRTDKDADTIQSSKDDEELLCMFIKTACNELVTAVALRFPSISYTIDEKEISINFETEKEMRDDLMEMLKHSIIDYLVNETIMQWLLLCRPGMAQPQISQHMSLRNNVMFMFAKLYNTQKTRRRATDLAGI